MVTKAAWRLQNPPPVAMKPLNNTTLALNLQEECTAPHEKQIVLTSNTEITLLS